jgi:hypothetical protein
MKFLLQGPRICTFRYESLNALHFFRGTSFNAPRVVKYKSRVAIEYQFVCNVVDATLEGYEVSSFGKVTEIHTPEEGSTLEDNFSSKDAVPDKMLTLPSAACAMHLRIVVFPAFGRPMISARNRPHFLRSLCVSELIAVWCCRMRRYTMCEKIVRRHTAGFPECLIRRTKMDDDWVIRRTTFWAYLLGLCRDDQ